MNTDMRRRMGGVVIALVLLAGAEARGQGFFAGFEPGAFVVIRETHRAGEQSQTKTFKMVVTNEAPAIAVYPETGRDPRGFPKFAGEAASVFTPAGAVKPSEMRMTVTKVGTETLTIEGVEHPCSVTTYGSPVAEITYWTPRPRKGEEPKARDGHPVAFAVPYYEFPADGPDIAVPAGTLKVRHVARFGTEAVTQTYQVISFAARMQVGTQEVVCVQQRITGEGSMRGVPIAVNGVQWLSDAVPGRLVKLEMEMKRGGEAVTMVKEAVEFGVGK